MRGDRLRLGDGMSQIRADKWRNAMTLLAIYGLADDEGLYCHATNEEIAAMAKLSGVGHSTIGRRIGMFADMGYIYTYRHKTKCPRRVIILADHPDAGRALAALCPEAAEKIMRDRSYGRALS